MSPCTDTINAAISEHGLAIVDVIADREGRAVYKARRNDGALVVLKLIHDDENSEDSGRARAEREVRAGFDVDHPHLARVFEDEPREVHLDDGLYCYFTQELIDGSSLEHSMGGWTPREVLVLIEHLARAIDDLWSRRIVHRDIKPANIVRRATDNSYVLIDVGFGRHQGLSSITHPQGWAGTVNYYSPEQLRPEHRGELDFRSDLYAVGIVAYEALSGSVPIAYPGRGQWDLYFTRMMDREYVPLSAPSELVGIIDRLLAPDPFLRYGRIGQLLDSVSEARGALQCS